MGILSGFCSCRGVKETLLEETGRFNQPLPSSSTRVGANLDTVKA